MVDSVPFSDAAAAFAIVLTLVWAGVAAALWGSFIRHSRRAATPAPPARRVDRAAATSVGSARRAGRPGSAGFQPAELGGAASARAAAAPPTRKTEIWRAATAQSEPFNFSTSQPFIFSTGNAYSYAVAIDEDADGVPLVMRGRVVEELDEDGVLSSATVSQSGGRIRVETRKSRAGAALPTYAVEEYDDTHGTLVRSSTYLSATDTLVADEINAYDEKNRLVSVRSASLTNGAIRVLNAYDHNDRRVRKTVQRLMLPESDPPAPPQSAEWTTIETHTYFYDDWKLIEERIARDDGTASTNRYIWGKDLSGSLQGAGCIGVLLAVLVSENTSTTPDLSTFQPSTFQPYFPCYDHNGNIVRYVSETGAVSASYSYDPFGNIIAATAPLVEDFTFGFSTKPLDRQTGLISYQRRFYSPFFGRWLNRDPIAESGGENNSSHDKTAYGTSCDGNDTHVETRHVFDVFGDMVQRLIRTNETDFTSETLSYTYDPTGRHAMRNDDSFVYNMRGEVVFADISDTATHYGCDEIGNSTNWTVNSANQYVPFDCDEDDNLFFDGVFDFAMPRREFVK